VIHKLGYVAITALARFGDDGTRHSTFWEEALCGRGRRTCNLCPLWRIVCRSGLARGDDKGLERLPALREQRVAPASTFPTAFAGGQALLEMSKWGRGAISPRLSTWIRTSMFSGGGLLLVADAISDGGQRRRQRQHRV
jgi:hypothetical protein